MLDNVCVAILVLVNELAARHGVQPYEFVATVSSDSVGGTILSYESPPADPATAARFDRMLGDLGLDLAEPDLTGTDQRVFETLQSALRLAPNRRPGR